MGEAVLIAEVIFAFAFLGFGFGVIYDFVTTLGKALNSKAVIFILDFLMTVFISVVFGCCLIAYSNGSFRGIYFITTVSVFVIYLLTLHKILLPIFSGIFSPLRKILKKFTKKLKNSEKSLKNLLHLGK